jgi:hypothetical protein
MNLSNPIYRKDAMSAKECEEEEEGPQIFTDYTD